MDLKAAPERLKGLSIRQPWAEMILQGKKTVEYRSQPTKIRGRVYLYASLGKSDLDLSDRREVEAAIGQAIESLPTGVVVGTVEITDCVGESGDYEWRLENPKRLGTPIKPFEQPQPVWFHPFGRPLAASESRKRVRAPKPPNNPLPLSSEMRFNRKMLPVAQLPTTAYHAKYLAFELTKRCASDNLDKLTAVLSDAQVDLNPHQVEAALFAFRNPLSKGAILADEVGLGKTIEAGLLLAQMWAERKKRLLVIAPANLRKQWAQELADKFFLPSVILENKTFNEVIRSGNLNPFIQDAVVICSYQFAKRMDAYVRQSLWDLVVIDEAHRLRNVYKPTNKIANAIKNAIEPYKKVLLTATPLQNSLLELYGLVSIIDDFAFGDLATYKARFTRLADNDDFHELKERLKPICKRTLRKQVLEYIKYTDRHAIVQEFEPSDDEHRLYNLVSDYLQSPALYALPASQRSLMTLILRKLLGSSTFAISDTLRGLADKLDSAINAAERVQDVPEDLPENIDDYDELADEWDEEEGEDKKEPKVLSPEDIAAMKREMQQLREFHELAKSIVKNSKGEVLLTALRKGFAASVAALQRGATNEAVQKKALIFTESRRTQEYLARILEQTEFAGTVVLFNGTNNDPKSKAIYKEWISKHQGTDRVSGSPAADMRAALVEYFRDSATIMIATEAAAEGVNLQFCNLVVNYDLPWNPQRIEQRIGRCHRYGQKCDVVVVNFLNKKNAADVRIYELLEEKFKLFEGVFGSSDEVLGAVESGVDFEKRIAAIYQRCRTPEQIQFEFDELQKELDTEISAGHEDAREKLLDNFDQEVIEKVRIQSEGLLDQFHQRLWLLTRYVLADYAEFDDDDLSFTLDSNPFDDPSIHSGPYRFGKRVEDANTYRIGSPLAQRVLALAKDVSLPPCEMVLNYTGDRKKVTAIESLVGQSGWLRITNMVSSSIGTEEHLLFAGFTEDNQPLDETQCRRLMDCPATLGSAVNTNFLVLSQLDRQIENAQAKVLSEISANQGQYFEAEIEKLDRWAEDLKESLEFELKQLTIDIKAAKRESRLVVALQDKLTIQKTVRDLEKKQGEKRKRLFEAQDEIDRRREGLIEEVQEKLAQTVSIVDILTIKWSLV